MGEMLFNKKGRRGFDVGDCVVQCSGTSFDLSL